MSPSSSPLTSATLPHVRQTHPGQSADIESRQLPPKSQQHPDQQQKGLSQSEIHIRTHGPSQFYNNSNSNVLHRAVSRRDIIPDVHFLEVLMTNRPSIIYEQDDMGCTPLHLAVANPKVRLPIVHLLVQEAPECCSVKDKNGCTPLNYAMDRNAVDLIRILSNAHAKVAETRDNPDDVGMAEKGSIANHSTERKLSGSVSGFGSFDTVPTVVRWNAYDTDNVSVLMLPPSSE